MRVPGPRMYQRTPTLLLSDMNPATVNPVIALQHAWESPVLEQRRSRRRSAQRRRTRTMIGTRLNAATPPLDG